MLLNPHFFVVGQYPKSWLVKSHFFNGQLSFLGYFVVSADRCVTEWNHRLADVTGKDKEAVAGKLVFTSVAAVPAFFSDVLRSKICGVSPIQMGVAGQTHVLRFHVLFHESM